MMMMMMMMMVSLLCSPQLSKSQDIPEAQEVTSSEDRQEGEEPPASPCRREEEEESCMWRVQLPFRGMEGLFNSTVLRPARAEGWNNPHLKRVKSCAEDLLSKAGDIKGILPTVVTVRLPKEKCFKLVKLFRDWLPKQETEIWFLRWNRVVYSKLCSRSWIRSITLLYSASYSSFTLYYSEVSVYICVIVCIIFVLLSVLSLNAYSDCSDSCQNWSSLFK